MLPEGQLDLLTFNSKASELEEMGEGAHWSLRIGCRDSIMGGVLVLKHAHKFFATSDESWSPILLLLIMGWP